MDQPEQTLEQTQDDFEFLRTLANMCARQFGRPADLMQKLISPRDCKFLRVSIQGLEALARRLLLILASQLSLPPLEEKLRARIAAAKPTRKSKRAKTGEGAAPRPLPADLPLTDGVTPDRVVGKLHRVFYEDQPEKWPVHLKLSAAAPRKAAPRKPLTEAERLIRWRRKHEPLWVHPQSLAERFEAVARVCRDPEHYARRLALRLQRRAARIEFRLPQAIKSVKRCLPPRRERPRGPDAPVNPAGGMLEALAMPAVRALAALYPRLRAEAQGPPEPVSVSLILAP